MLDWILVIVVYSAGSNGVAVTNIDFPTQESCTRALHQLKDVFTNGYRHAQAACVKRNA